MATLTRRDALKLCAGGILAGSLVKEASKPTRAAKELDLAQAGELSYSSNYPYAIRYPSTWSVSTFGYPDGYGGLDPVDRFSCPDSDAFEDKSTIEIHAQDETQPIENLADDIIRDTIAFDSSVNLERFSLKGLLPSYKLEGVGENINGEKILGFSQVIFNDIDGISWYILQ